MVKCVFCGKEEYSFKGVHLIKNTGVVHYFCSSKCIKNANKLGRDKRKVRWTEAFHETRDKMNARKKEAEIKKIESDKATKKEMTKSKS